MTRRSFLRSRFGVAAMILAAALAGTAAATAGPTSASEAFVPPTPMQFVSGLDLECFRTTPYTPPSIPPLTLSHLNPVLTTAGAAPWTITGIGERTQLCSPVLKNNVVPSPGTDVLEFIRYVDLSCYRIGGPSLNLSLTLDQLNPVLKDIPRKKVNVLNPEQLCLPVIKNNSVPSAEVLQLIRYIDLVCYRETPPAVANVPLTLTQLNPVLADIPPTDVRLTNNRQLCVPVRKNNQQMPEGVQKIVQWIDLEKYDMTAPAMAPWNLTLHHVNPLMQGWPAEPTTLLDRGQLAVPVAKNGNNPTTS